MVALLSWYNDDDGDDDYDANGNYNDNDNGSGNDNNDDDIDDDFHKEIDNVVEIIFKLRQFPFFIYKAQHMPPTRS